jgi:polyhydroxybutyrate depolymerase
VNVPSGYDPAKPLPLVIFLHGLGGSGQAIVRHLHVVEIANAKHFLWIAPDGIVDSKGRRFWNATRACCDFDHRGVDDVAYVAALIDEAKKQYRVDEGRVYAVGSSNGGFMVLRLACELSDRFAGVVSLAGAGFEDPSRCQPKSPVAVLQIHGELDRIVPYDGGRVLRRRRGASHPSAKDTIALWAQRNGCAATAEKSDPVDLDDQEPGAETRVLRHQGCRGGAAELWTIPGGSHFIGQRRAAAEEIVGFLLSHPKTDGK